MDEKLKYPNTWLVILFGILSAILLIAFPIVFLLTQLYILFCIYRIHQILQSLYNNNYPISPFSAAINHFMPFYNFYWIFKWPSVFSEKLKIENIESFICPTCNHLNEVKGQKNKSINTNEFLRSGIKLYETEKYKDAINDFNQCLEIDENNSAALYYRRLLRATILEAKKKLFSSK